MGAVIKDNIVAIFINNPILDESVKKIITVPADKRINQKRYP